MLEFVIYEVHFHSNANYYGIQLIITGTIYFDMDYLNSFHIPLALP